VVLLIVLRLAGSMACLGISVQDWRLRKASVEAFDKSSLCSGTDGVGILLPSWHKDKLRLSLL
jgi:hypothetical protein